MKRFALAITGLLLASCTPPPSSDAGSSSLSASTTSSSMPMVASLTSSKAAMAESSISAAMKKSDASSAQAAASAKALAKPSPATTDEEWKMLLTEQQYAVLRQAGTETPFTSPLVDEHRKGTFVTADCGDPVFRSEQKYDSGTGWPSFWQPITPDAVVEAPDNAHGMQRVEIKTKCGGHLGHVFTDGPKPTGLRYCMNGLALKFIPDEDQE